MKKLSFFITTLATMLIFGVSTLNAAPSTGGGALTNQTKQSTTQKRATSSAKKATNKKASSTRATSSQTRATNKANTPLAQKSKAQLRKEAQQKAFGLMPSELDRFNRSVFHAKAAAVKGARDTESALRYLPFVTIINTAGFGQSFDMRGQGRLSANGVKLYINGIVANPVDSYFQPMPIATIIPSLIREVNVYPGSGAVLYGSGTKGGTINIVTSKREAPYFLVGGGYVNTMATEGHSFNAYAQAVENLGAHIKMNAGLAFNQMGGPREDDSQWGGQAVLGAEYDIGWGQTISFDIDAFMGKTKTTPYNSLLDEPAINQAVFENPIKQTGGGTTSSSSSENGRQNAIANLSNKTPDKSERADKGEGEIESTNMRITGDIIWKNQLSQKLEVNVKGFGALSQIKYDKYTMSLPYFVLGMENPNNPNDKGYLWFLPRFNNSQGQGNINDVSYWTSGDGARTDWHFLDQSGTSSTGIKAGGRADLSYKHGTGEFLFGLSSIYEMNKRDSKSYLRRAIISGFDAYSDSKIIIDNNKRYTLSANIDSKIDMNVMTNAVYLMELYNFNPYFTLTGGARYEMKNYNVKVDDKYDIQSIYFPTQTGTGNGAQTNYDVYQNTGHSIDIVKKEYSKNYDNFTFEVSPVFNYSNSGSVYLRGEMGYIAPPAWAMLRRVGKLKRPLGYITQEDLADFNQASNQIRPDFDYKETEVKSETYWTAELGWKELIGTRVIPLYFTNFDINTLLFSANVFYTQSQNEFYFEGDTWSGMQYKNYDKSRRMGVELAAEQYFFNGALGFNESFTYIKAEKMGCIPNAVMTQNPRTGECTTGTEWQPIPYTYDFKATFGANINIAHYLEIVDVSVGIWLQNSLYGNQHIPVTELYTQGAFYANEVESKKLDPYIISDFGVSVGLNKNAAIITVGIKNIFDTFYYDYYNNDRSAVVNENRYIIGRGRTVFLEGEWRY